MADCITVAKSRLPFVLLNTQVDVIDMAIVPRANLAKLYHARYWQAYGEMP